MTPKDAPTTDRPYAIVLGTAQDGGTPQIGCQGPECTAARTDPDRVRLVTSLCVADPRTGRRYLFDATPDLREQVERARAHPPGRVEEGPRPALFDGIFLTHAHMGHYTGLLHLGPEAYGARDVPLYVSERMEQFLRGNEPWNFLIQNGTLAPVRLRDLEPVEIGPGLTVTPIFVPHRDELTDTFAFRIEGPGGSLLYCPDTDGWGDWSPSVETRLAEVDVALVDGTFFDVDEVPGRDLSKIPHPFIAASVERFLALSAEERGKVRFTHLNHTNPATDPGSEAALRVKAAGMEVARDLERHGL